MPESQIEGACRAPLRHLSRARSAHGAAPGVYRRHRPETTALYEVVRDNLETLLGAVDDGALAVRIPRHARKELLAYLDCGLLCRGFARLKCRGCSETRLVAFSCKGRGYVKRLVMRSCAGRGEAQSTERATTTSHNPHDWSDAINASGGRNLPGRSCGGVTAVSAPIRCVTSTRR